MKYATLGKISAIVLVAFFVMAPAEDTAFTVSGSNSNEVRQRASLDLIPTEVFRDIEGEADLRLSMGGENAARFKSSATAQGEGIIDGAFYSLCVKDGVDDLFIDADEAEELLFNEDEAIAELEAELEPSPFIDLLGLTVTIRLGIGCHDHSVLHGVVTQLD